MADCSLGTDACRSVDGHSARCVEGLLNNSEYSNILQVKHIRATKHYEEPQRVQVDPKSTPYRIPEGFLKDFLCNMAPTSGPKGGSTSKNENFCFYVLWPRTLSFDYFCMKKTIQSFTSIFCVSKAKIVKIFLNKLNFAKIG